MLKEDKTPATTSFTVQIDQDQELVQNLLQSVDPWEYFKRVWAWAPRWDFLFKAIYACNSQSS